MDFSHVGIITEEPKPGEVFVEATRGMKVLLEPFQPLPNLRVGFYESSDGGVVEFVEYQTGPFSDR